MALDPVIAGHPLHPIFVTMPVGLFSASYILDIVAAASNNDKLAEAAYYNMLLGYLGTSAALTSGYLDFLQMAKNDPAYSTATKHGWLNLSLTGLYTVNLLVRRKHKRNKFGFLLSTLGTLGLVVTGYLGGEMAYGRGWRVRPVERFELEWQKLRKVGLFDPQGFEAAATKPQVEEYPQEVIKGFNELKSGAEVLKDIQQGHTQSSFDQLQAEKDHSNNQ
jgi:uncharacterized membrane protein